MMSLKLSIDTYGNVGRTNPTSARKRIEISILFPCLRPKCTDFYNNSGSIIIIKLSSGSLSILKIVSVIPSSTHTFDYNTNIPSNLPLRITGLLIQFFDNASRGSTRFLFNHDDEEANHDETDDHMDDNTMTNQATSLLIIIDA